VAHSANDGTAVFFISMPARLPPMMPPRPTQLAWMLLREALHDGDLAIDATAGNGHDTAFLAECVGENGSVLAFDVQPEAIRSTRARLAAAGLDHRVELCQQSHVELARHASPGSVAAVIFNLGYLPGGDHQLTTTSADTLTALDTAAGLLKPAGVICVVCYPGHAAGAGEAADVEAWMAARAADGWRVAKYAMLGTRRPAPFLIAAVRGVSGGM